MKIQDIKFGEHVLGSLDVPRFFADLVNKTSLDHKTLQRTLDKLRKHGYVARSSREEWCKVQDATD